MTAPLDDYITAQECHQLSVDKGDPISHQAITQHARDGKFEGAKQVGRQRTWMIPRETFLHWLLYERKKRGPPPDQLEGA
jgi:hypothetical protein